MRHTAGPDEKPLRSKTFSTVYTWHGCTTTAFSSGLLSLQMREKRKHVRWLSSQVLKMKQTSFFLRLGIRSGKKVKGKELICFQHWKTQIDSSLAIFVHAFFFGYLPMCITKLLARYSKKWTSLKRNKT